LACWLSTVVGLLQNSVHRLLKPWADLLQHIVSNSGQYNSQYIHTSRSPLSSRAGNRQHILIQLFVFQCVIDLQQIRDRMAAAGRAAGHPRQPVCAASPANATPYSRRGPPHAPAFQRPGAVGGSSGSSSSSSSSSGSGGGAAGRSAEGGPPAGPTGRIPAEDRPESAAARVLVFVAGEGGGRGVREVDCRGHPGLGQLPLEGVRDQGRLCGL
jgi:hypothetical protein